MRSAGRQHGVMESGIQGIYVGGDKGCFKGKEEWEMGEKETFVIVIKL